MTQPASEESNSSVKSRGSGVKVGSRVAVDCGVLVTGIGVGGTVAVGNSGAIGVGVAAGVQAVMKRKHPMRSFFIVLIKTYLSEALFQTIDLKMPEKHRDQSQFGT